LIQRVYLLFGRIFKNSINIRDFLGKSKNILKYFSCQKNDVLPVEIAIGKTHTTGVRERAKEIKTQGFYS